MNHYEVLGLPLTATRADIKKAYYKLALKFHPDKLHSSSFANEDDFKKLQEAFETLFDDDKRRAYDDLLQPSQSISWISYLCTLFKTCVVEASDDENQPKPAASTPRY